MFRIPNGGRMKQKHPRTIRKKQLKDLGKIMRKECLENLALTGHIESKKRTIKQQPIYLTNVCKAMKDYELQR